MEAKILESYGEFCNEAKVFPIPEYLKSHTFSYITNVIAMKMAKEVASINGYDKPFPKRGIPRIPLTDNLEVWIRGIFADGTVWCQIGHTGRGGSQAEVSGMTAKSILVIKNMDDIKRLMEETEKRYSDIEKKGYLKEIKALAKEMKIKPELDSKGVKQLAAEIEEKLPEAKVKVKEKFGS